MLAARAISSPAAAMATVARERRLGTGFGVIVLAALVGLISSVISVFAGAAGGRFSPQNFPTVPPETLRSVETAVQVALPVLAVLSPFLWWVVVSLSMQLVTRFFGGNGPLPAMFAVVGVAYVPLLVAAVVNLPLAVLEATAGPQSGAATAIGLISSALSLAFLVWHVALVIVGASFARQISYGQSGGSCAISCVGFAVLVFLILLALILILAFAAGAFGGR